MDAQWIDRIFKPFIDQFSLRSGRPASLARDTRLFWVLEPRVLFDGAGMVPEEWDDPFFDGHPGEEAIQDGTLQHPEPMVALAAAVQGHLLPEVTTRREIVLIDPQVEQAQTLLAGASPQRTVVVLEANQDGVEQIAEILAQQGPFDAIHILSHGQTAQVALGTARLSADNLDHYTALLRQWGEFITPDGDILLYGCDVGAGEGGADFVQRMAEITGADVAASADLTGAESKGGDWDLEVASGSIDATAPLSSDVQARYEGILAVTAIDLAGLNGANGFRLDGVAAGDLSGLSVHSAGDINGDGLEDIIVGARNAAGSHGANSGSSFVVFGQATGFAATINLGTLNGANGFRLDGAASGDNAGYSVSSVGDHNGDGYDDLIIGAYNAATGAGASFLVFGKAAAFDATLDLATLDGATGFRLNGVTAGDWSGWSVSEAGDINGDGFDDLIIGAYKANPNAEAFPVGAGYVVFGKAAGFGATLDLGTLNGATGFRLDGVAAGDYAGVSVSDAGDINGDGYGDLIVGAHWASQGAVTYAGASFVVFGKASGFGATVNLATLDGATGFRLDGTVGGVPGDQAGRSVSAAGDFNGDGFDDLIVGAYRADPAGGADAGSSYVVFGKASGFDAVINLSALTSATGFRLDGVAGDDQSGRSVSAAGDLNGDGFDDVIIGARYADPTAANAGASYVVFGQASGFSTISLSANDFTGFRLNGLVTNDWVGVSVSGVGDIDGDGFDDFIVGAAGADPGALGNAGSSYIIFGSNVTGLVTFSGTSGADTLNAGTSAAERFVAGRGNDTMTGGGGADIFHGGAGDDTITVSDLTFQLVDGGRGSDTLALSGAAMTLSLATLRGKIEGIETIDLTGSGNNTLVLTALDLLNLSDSSNTLTVIGNTGDSVEMGSGWTDGGVAGGYRTYTQGQATLRVSETAPTLTSFAGVVGVVNEDQQATITLANLKAQGDEVDLDGTVDAFIVKAVTTGTLLIGTSAGAATPWAAGTNETVDATRHAYWTGAQDANGTLNAFTVVVKDNSNTESGTVVQVPMSVTAVNDNPTGSVTISGTATQGQTLTASNALADVDGLGVISYQWRGNGANISGATGSTLVLAEAQVGTTITVLASYTDTDGTAESQTSSATSAVANINDAPTGSVTISGTATQGQTLTAANTLADADGLGTISYQWRANGTNISGATGSTWVLAEAQVGSTVTVVASYTDGHGTAESQTSSATGVVAALTATPAPAPPSVTPAPSPPSVTPAAPSPPPAATPAESAPAASVAVTPVSEPAMEVSDLVPLLQTDVNRDSAPYVQNVDSGPTVDAYSGSASSANAHSTSTMTGSMLETLSMVDALLLSDYASSASSVAPPMAVSSLHVGTPPAGVAVTVVVPSAVQGQAVASHLTEIGRESGMEKSGSGEIFVHAGQEREDGFLAKKRTLTMDVLVGGLVKTEGLTGVGPESEKPVKVEGFGGAGRDERGVAVEGFGGRSTTETPVKVEGFGDVGAGEGYSSQPEGLSDSAALYLPQDEEENLLIEREPSESGEGSHADSARKDSVEPETQPGEEQDERMGAERADTGEEDRKVLPKKTGKLAFTAQMHPFGSQGFHQTSMALLKKMVESQVRSWD